MEYSLAKQLKEAGFPQNIKEGDWFFYYGKPLLASDDYEYGENWKPDDLKCPTLSELIEACGEKFHELHHCTRGFNADARWYWTAWPHDPYRQSIGGIDGNTPEEAVAKLWLELNK